MGITHRGKNWWGIVNRVKINGESKTGVKIDGAFQIGVKIDGE
jgi:hypothetical protein